MDAFSIVKNEEGKHAINRWISVLSFFVLSFGFISQSIKFQLHWMEYATYALGALFCYSPVYAIDVLKLIRDIKTGNRGDDNAKRI